MENKPMKLAELFGSIGQSLDESLAFAGALTAGKLTRSQFDEWSAHRTSEGSMILNELRRQVPAVAEPVDRAVAFGRALVAGLSPQPAASPRPHARHRRTEKVLHPARKRRVT